MYHSRISGTSLRIRKAHLGLFWRKTRFPAYSMTASLFNAKVLKQEDLNTKDAKWVQLIKTTYNGADNKTRDWESAIRRTRPKGSLIDGVCMVAILDKPTGPEILLQKQYRPPIDKVCIEIPAGLIDAGESAEACALRELKEETGYVGEVMKGTLGISPILFNDPGFCNTNGYMVHVTIDMQDPRNQNPKPETEENEFIECFTIPLSQLQEQCKRFEEQGYAIDGRVGSLAEGLEVAKKWKLA